VVPFLRCIARWDVASAVYQELKGVKDIVPEHKAQVINYLKATNLKLGLLINFGSHPKAQIERFAL
jgi:GxxExxY protein